MSDIRISELNDFPDVAWDQFVEQHPDGQFFHLSSWGRVYQELNWVRPHFLKATRDNELVGVMPLAAVSVAMRRIWVSSPYCVHAGVLASDRQAEQALHQTAIEAARNDGARHLEIRQLSAAVVDSAEGHSYANFSRALATEIEDNRRAIPRKQRAVIRKAEAAGLETLSEVDLPTFYQLYCRSMRSLGTPAYGETLFESIMRHFPQHTGLHAVGRNNEILSVVLSFYFRGRVMPYYAGASESARAAKANDFMYWTLLLDALERNCDTFDFGRSMVGTGAYAFKKNWGFEPQPLNYTLTPLADASAAPLDPESTFNRLARQSWQRLPLAVANVLGPLVSRRLY